MAPHPLVLREHLEGLAARKLCRPVPELARWGDLDPAPASLPRPLGPDARREGPAADDARRPGQGRHRALEVRKGRAAHHLLRSRHCRRRGRLSGRDLRRDRRRPQPHLGAARGGTQRHRFLRSIGAGQAAPAIIRGARREDSPDRISAAGRAAGWPRPRGTAKEPAPALAAARSHRQLPRLLPRRGRALPGGTAGRDRRPAARDLRRRGRRLTGAAGADLARELPARHRREKAAARAGGGDTRGAERGSWRASRSWG